MSCQLKFLSKFKAVQQLKQFLHPACAGSDEDATTSSDDWGGDWGWGDSNPEQEGEPEISDEWLSNCEVAVSSLGDLVAVAVEDRLAILQVSYEAADDGMFNALWKGRISEFPREEITCVLCLPIISHKQSSPGSPEWTCIVVGFNTGHVRMYNETGTKIIDQMMHNESVRSIKCKTYSFPRYPGASDLSEELTILYETVLVTLEGFGFFQTLRACKNQAAMAAAGSTKVTELPHLVYKKWGFKDQGHCADHFSAGSCTPNPFDQLHTASMAGFYERISAVPPTANIYGACGDNPYASIYFMKEGETTHLLSDVKDAATKLLSVGASTLFSWGSSFLTKKSTQPTEKPVQKIEPATYLPARFCLKDKQRIGQTLVMSPFGNTAASTDSLGRVILIDVYRGIIKRIWKGYRNAQVGWISVKEPSTSRSSAQRHAVFLLIYAPKRGLLEVWLADNGPRVGAFNVGKGCRLVYPGCSLLGLNSSTYRHVKGKMVQCCLLKSSGELMEVIIPFHLSLSDSNSRRAHDEQIIKLVRSLLKEEDLKVSVLWEPINKLKLTSSYKAVLDKILTTSMVNESVACGIIDNITVHINKMAASAQNKNEGGQELVLDIESRLLLDFCQAKKILIEMYAALVKLNSTPAEKPITGFTVDDILPANEVKQLLGIRFPENAVKKVAFTSDASMSLPEFLTCVTVPHGASSISLLPSLTDEQMSGLGWLIFKPCIENGVEVDVIHRLITPLRCSPRSLLVLLLKYYTSLSSPNADDLPALHLLVNNLYVLDSAYEPEKETHAPKQGDSTPLITFNQTSAPFNITQSWWELVRDLCETSSHLRSYFYVALVSRSICLIHSEKMLCKPEDSEPADTSAPQAPPEIPPPEIQAPAKELWENLTLDVELWSLCIKHIEDVALLNIFLQWKPNLEATERRVADLNFVSVKDVKNANRGCIGEFVGKWCVANRISASDMSRFIEHLPSEGDEDPFRSLKSVFPLSLTDDIINANACWEYASFWNKDVESLTNLQLSLEYLDNIRNGCLRHGLSVLMWKIYLVKRLSSLVSLMDKVGKAPKDRLCKKELDMDSATCTEFMKIVCNFMKIFLQSNCDFGAADLYDYEIAWLETWSGHSLLDMACQQRETNYRLLNHHASLMIIITAVLSFNMKSAKIMTLFDHNGVHAFFKELNAHPYLSNEGKNEIVSSNRKAFLCQVLRHYVQSLVQQKSGNVIPQVNSSHKNEMKWSEIVLQMAEKFEMDKDIFKRFYMKELVSHGYDVLAVEILSTVQDVQAACTDLLELCSQRIAYLLSSADQANLSDIACKVSPSLLGWLHEKDHTQLAVRSIPVADTSKLLLYAVKGLKSSPSVYRYADELYNFTTLPS